MCSHRRLRSACASVQSDQSLMGALRVAKGPMFLQAELKDSDQIIRMQTDLNLRCTHMPVPYAGHPLIIITPDRRQSKTLLTVDERGSKIARYSVFDCHLSPVGRQMAIENSVSNDF